MEQVENSREFKNIDIDESTKGSHEKMANC
jgi:hypothetical protein